MNDNKLTCIKDVIEWLLREPDPNEYIVGSFLTGKDIRENIRNVYGVEISDETLKSIITEIEVMVELGHQLSTDLIEEIINVNDFEEFKEK